MKENKWKKFARYYKPYLGSFAADMFFAILGAAVSAKNGFETIRFP